MKKFLFLILSIIVVIDLNAQQTYIISKGVGNTFNPTDLTVNQGDIVHFNLTSPHIVLQVSLATWNADGITPLAGGFSFPSGSGDYTATTPGILYYVCTQHVGDGMKGTIVVNAVTGINDIQKNSNIKVFPNPATDYITYRTRGNSIVQEIRILDITGKSVKILQYPEFSENQVKIDIGNLNHGLYFILVRFLSGTETGKFLKS